MFNLNQEWLNSFIKIIFWRKKMKNVFIFLWGMIITSGWWGVGLMSYFNCTEDSIGALLGLMIAISIPTVIYMFSIFGLCVAKCWDD